MAQQAPSAVRQQLAESIAVKQALLDDAALVDAIEDVAALVGDTYRRGRKLLLAGNGGSAADAQHIAAELVCRFMVERPALPAIALTTDSSILTAASNDFGYEYVFARQVAAYGDPGDLFLAISTSGNSPNILRALEAARAGGLTCVGLTGAGGGAMAGLCDHCLRVPSTETPRIQECHITIGHILCAAAETQLFCG